MAGKTKPTKKAAARTASAKKAKAKKAAAKKATAKKAAAKQAAPRKTSPQKAPGEKAPSKKAAGKKAPGKKAAGKPLSGPPRDADGMIDRARLSAEHFADLVGRPFSVTVGDVTIPMTLLASEGSRYPTPPNALRHPFSLIFESTASDILRGDGTYRLDGPDGLQLDHVLITPILRPGPHDGAIHYQICFG